MKINNYPLVTIVTVSFNSLHTIEETIKSVVNQSYPQLEYIIIDGGSTDGTVDVIKKYSSCISYWESTPDKGIFDAMNKAVKHATGKWINFMNCGDTFFSNDTLINISSFFQLDASVLYGNVNSCRKSKSSILNASPINTILHNMPFCHQSSFVRVSHLKKKPFDTSFKLCADYDNFYSLYKSGARFVQMPFVIANFEAEEGVSSVRITELKREIHLITGRSMLCIHLEYFLRKVKSILFSFL